MQHCIITRFNVKTGFGSNRGIDPVSSDWLHHRCELFRTYCLPSFRAQTVKNYEWFLLVHPDTPEHYFSDLSDIATIVRVETNGAGVSRIRRSRVAGISISTRVDNDDAVAPNFVELLQSTARHRDQRGATSSPFVMDFPNSCRFSTGDRTTHSHRWRYTSSFSSLAEPIVTAADWRSVYCFDHSKLGQNFPLENIETDLPMTMTVVHGRNIVNSIREGMTEMPSLEGRFPGPHQGLGAVPPPIATAI